MLQLEHYRKKFQARLELLKLAAVKDNLHIISLVYDGIKLSFVYKLMESRML